MQMRLSGISKNTVNVDTFRKLGWISISITALMVIGTVLFIIANLWKTPLIAPIHFILLIPVTPILFIVLWYYLINISYVSNWFTYSGILGIISNVFGPVFYVVIISSTGGNVYDAIVYLSYYSLISVLLYYLTYTFFALGSIDLDYLNNTNEFKILALAILAVVITYHGLYGMISYTLYDLLNLDLYIVNAYENTLFNSVLSALWLFWGHGFLQIYEDLESTLMRADLEEKILTDIEHYIATGSPMHIVYYSWKKGLKPILVLIKLNQLIQLGKVKGYVANGFFYSLKR